MSFSTQHVANTLLKWHFDSNKKISIDRLQCLLYIVNSESIKRSGEPCIDESFICSDTPRSRSIQEYYYPDTMMFSSHNDGEYRDNDEIGFTPLDDGNEDRDDNNTFDHEDAENNSENMNIEESDYYNSGWGLRPPEMDNGGPFESSIEENDPTDEEDDDNIEHLIIDPDTPINDYIRDQYRISHYLPKSNKTILLYEIINHILEKTNDISTIMLKRILTMPSSAYDRTGGYMCLQEINRNTVFNDQSYDHLIGLNEIC